MDHEERLRRFQTDPSTLDPETRERNRELRAQKKAQRERGHVNTALEERYKGDIPDFRPVPPEEQASTSAEKAGTNKASAGAEWSTGTSQPQLTRETMVGPFPLPPVDDDLRAEARRKPGQWITFLDPAIDPSVSNPPWFSVQGGYHADENGQIDDYRINAQYEPSPTRAGFEFHSGTEIALWRVLHGYQSLGRFVDSLYHADLLTYAQSAEDVSFPLIQDPHNPVFSTFMVATSSQWCHWEHTNTISGGSLFEMVGEAPEVLLDINPATRFGMRMRVCDLASLITEDTPHLIEQFRRRQQTQQE